MAQIEREVIIKYRWWNENLDKIDSKHAEALEESAMEWIVDMHDNDPEDGIEYRGWWDILAKNSSA